MNREKKVKSQPLARSASGRYREHRARMKDIMGQLEYFEMRTKSKEIATGPEHV